jgi:hypothetical protein
LAPGLLTRLLARPPPLNWWIAPGFPEGRAPITQSKLPRGPLAIDTG